MPRKKQRRAWGSVTEIKRGKKYVLRWMENTPEGRKRKTRTVYGTYREACAALDMIHAEKREDYVAPTIGEVYKRWFLPQMDRRLAEGEIKKNTHYGHIKMWRKHVGPRWSGVPSDCVKPLDVQTWLDGMTAANAELALGLAKQIMDLAVIYEITPVNKFRSKYRLPARTGGLSKGVYDNKESDAVLRKLKGQLLEAAYIIMRYGGARTGEALGVRVDEIRFVAHCCLDFAVVPIVRRMDKAKEPIDDLKTAESRRSTVIPPPYSIRLKEICSDLTAEGICWVAHNGDGMPMDTGRANYLWRTACDKAAGKKLIPMRNLRTSWRTSAELEWRIDTRLLELMMGHKLDGTTGKHYMRPGEDMVAETFMEAFAKNATT